MTQSSIPELQLLQCPPLCFSLSAFSAFFVGNSIRLMHKKENVKEWLEKNTCLLVLLTAAFNLVCLISSLLAIYVYQFWNSNPTSHEKRDPNVQQINVCGIMLEATTAAASVVLTIRFFQNVIHSVLACLCIDVDNNNRDSCSNIFIQLQSIIYVPSTIYGFKVLASAWDPDQNFPSICRDNHVYLFLLPLLVTGIFILVDLCTIFLLAMNCLNGERICCTEDVEDVKNNLIVSPTTNDNVRHCSAPTCSKCRYMEAKFGTQTTKSN